MDDLISRQAAIDAVIKHLQLDYEYAWGVREAINGLPTAEPEIIRCKECIYYENETHGLCDLGGEWAPDDYCSYGRRPKHG